MLNRVLKMEIGEVVDRSRQEAAKWLDRNSVEAAKALEGVSELSRPQSASALGREDFRQMGPGRFFAGATDERTPGLLIALTPEHQARSLESAERITARRFDLLGYRDLWFGDPVVWRLDPVSHRSFPFVHWTLIDLADPLSTGDPKVVWELNRHQFLATLGVAYRTTGDAKFAGAFKSLLRSWMRSNPPGFGVNWASSLEVALRIVSWSWALLLFSPSDSLTPDFLEDISEGILSHASHVERYLSRHSSPNTHLTGEALGLLYAGLLFPEHRFAERWRSQGQEILEEQAHVQIRKDGTYFEQSTAYQSYTIEIYLHYLVLAERNGLTVSSLVRERVQLMLDLLLALRRPDGSMPTIGDADGGSLLPLVPRAPGDPRGLFAIAAVLFGRGDYAWAAEGLQPEALWFFGPEALDRNAALEVGPPSGASLAFVDGGLVVMRSGWARDAHQLILDAGPLGCPMTAAHGHADLLSVQLSAFGEPCVVDPGTYAYSADPGLREHFRGTAAHSTVLVDGRGQAEPKGTFGWAHTPAAVLRRFLTGPDCDFADASHEAYSRLRDPVSHRRRVVFVKNAPCWVIVDDLSGRREHRLEVRYQFAPLPLTILHNRWVRAGMSGGRAVLVRAFCDVPLDQRIVEGSTDPTEGWVSRDYGHREPAPLLVYTATARLPLRVITLLLPVEDEEKGVPQVKSSCDSKGAIDGLVFGETGNTLRFDSDTFTMGGPDKWSA